MKSPILTIDQDEIIKFAAQKIYDNKVGCLLVTSEKNNVGIITKTDLMIRVLLNNLDPDTTKVAEIMSQPLVCIDAGETCDSAKDLMNQKTIRHLMVSRDDKIVGILSIKDL